MTWGPMGRGGECPECKAITAERDRLVAENAELRDGILPSQVHAHSHYQHVKRQLAAANARLDALREVVPYHGTTNERMKAIVAILYPKETDNG